MRTVLLLCLALGLALAAVKADEAPVEQEESGEAVVVNSSGDLDASEVAESDAETPTRQAQRSHMAERQQQVLSMRMQQVDQQSAISSEAEASASTETERRRVRRWRKRGGRPFAHRVSGAARSFAPNDRMCVLCQFMVQRAQQDLATMYGVTVGPEGLSAGLATAAATTPSVFVFAEENSETAALDEAEDEADAEDEVSTEEAEELEDEQADEADDEEDTESEDEDEEESEEEESDESEDEAEDDSEDESEDESEEETDSEDEEEAEDEDAAFLQIAEVESESDETEGEWTTPEFTNENKPITAALIEQRAAQRADNEGEWTTPEFLPEAAHEEVEMATADIAENAEAAEAEEAEAVPENHDQVETVFFESNAKAKSDEGEDSEWTTPEYALAETKAKVSAKGEDESEGEGGAEWQAPEYSDSMAANSDLKEYAKVIAPVGEVPSGILLEAANAADTTIFRPRTIRRRGGRGRRGPRRMRSRRYYKKGPARHATVAATPYRYKVSDRLVARPRWNRFDPFSPRHPNPQREAARAQFDKATHLSYDRLEAYCSTRLPELFGKFCRVVLRRFRKVAEGLRYGDRPNQVCMAIKMCPRGSYVRKSPHNVLKRFHRH